MTENETKALVCIKCHKEYPPGTASCPVDGGEFVVTAPDPLVGKLFAEKYEILSVLGEGGMSRVYKARHKFMDRIVAVKLMHDHMSDPTASARFQQEAQAASKLSHQNVVTVHDFGFTPSNQPYFVMDCLEGKSIGDLLEESGTLSVETALDIFTQACEGLDHAHRQGIIHRDIKPSNLVIIKQADGSNLVKVIDFGIAKMMIAPPEEGAKRQRQLTQTGEIFGTPAYMSPEQCNGRPLDARSDLYSFGCLMYEALSGEPPFLGETFITTVVKHINEKPKRLSETIPQAKIPEHVEAVVMKCLEKNPDDRFASAQELKQALYDAAFASGIKGLRVGAVPEPKPGAAAAASQVAPTPSLAEESVTRRWRNRLAYTLAAVTVGLALAGWWVFLYPGPEGDRGTVFSKISWQAAMSQAEDAATAKNYPEAIKKLEECKRLSTNFGDDNRRLETTLNTMVQVYGDAGNFVEQQVANEQLARMTGHRIHREYNDLMSLLNSWKTPAGGEARELARKQQAIAFGERIARCSEFLVRDKDKQERLLKSAIDVYDRMNLSTPVIRFRLTLAENLRAQQKNPEMRNVLMQALQALPDVPKSQEDWKLKIRAQMLLGQLDRNEALDPEAFGLSKKYLEKASEWADTRTPLDLELRRDCYNSLAVFYHMAKDETTSAEWSKKATALESKINEDDDDSKP